MFNLFNRVNYGLPNSTIFIATADGISTGRDVSTGNTSTTIGADNVIETKMSLKVGAEDRFNSHPGPDKKHNDLDYFALLVWSF